MLRALLVLLAFAPAWAGDSIAIVDRHALALEHSAATPTHGLTLVLAYFENGWKPEVIRAAVRKSARILAQCGVELTRKRSAAATAPHARSSGIRYGWRAARATSASWSPTSWPTS